MTLKLWHAPSSSSSSSLVTRDAIATIFSDVLGNKFPDLTSAQWHKQFQNYFYEMTRAEFSDPQQMAQIATSGLNSLHNSIVNENGINIRDIVESGWNQKTPAVITFKIHGTGIAHPVEISESVVNDWVTNHLAEPAVAQLSGQPSAAPSDHLLFALGGGAECAPTLPWLSAGGNIACVMRSGQTRWAQYISHARSTAGVLYVPVLASQIPEGTTELDDKQLAAVAGLDLIENPAEIAQWLSIMSDELPKTIIAAFAYSPGASHVVVQGVQDSLMAQAIAALPKEKIVLSWLGTPTDSIAVDLSILEDRIHRFDERSLLTRVRDLGWRLIGGLRAPVVDIFETTHGASLALIDCSAGLQGANYLFAKRSQRWRAYLADSVGVQVAYVVTPPARTTSVLRHRILRASYKGAKHFGFIPFGVPITQTLSAALLIEHLRQPLHSDPLDPAQLSVRLAVHGGLWRTAYEPQSVWVPATVRGLLGWFSSESAAKN